MQSEGLEVGVHGSVVVGKEQGVASAFLQAMIRGS